MTAISTRFESSRMYSFPCAKMCQCSFKLPSVPRYPYSHIRLPMLVFAVRNSEALSQVEVSPQWESAFLSVNRWIVFFAVLRTGLHLDKDISVMKQMETRNPSLGCNAISMFPSAQHSVTMQRALALSTRTSASDGGQIMYSDAKANRLPPLYL